MSNRHPRPPTPDPYDNYYSYRPTSQWQELIVHFGALAARPEGRAARPMFDFVKQLSTSCRSVSFHPSIVDDTLYIARGPLHPNSTPQARIGIEMPDAERVLLDFYPAGSSEKTSTSVARIEALQALNALLDRL